MIHVVINCTKETALKEMDMVTSGAAHHVHTQPHVSATTFILWFCTKSVFKNMYFLCIILWSKIQSHISFNTFIVLDVWTAAKTLQKHPHFWQEIKSLQPSPCSLSQSTLLGAYSIWLEEQSAVPVVRVVEWCVAARLPHACTHLDVSPDPCTPAAARLLSSSPPLYWEVLVVWLLPPTGRHSKSGHLLILLHLHLIPPSCEHIWPGYDHTAQIPLKCGLFICDVVLLLFLFLLMIFSQHLRCLVCVLCLCCTLCRCLTPTPLPCWILSLRRVRPSDVHVFIPAYPLGCLSLVVHSSGPGVRVCSKLMFPHGVFLLCDSPFTLFISLFPSHR